MSFGNTVKDGTGTPYWLLVDTSGRLITRSESQGTLSLSSDTTANDSDKSFTVTTAKVWNIQWMYISYSSTATAGDREICFEVQNASAVVIFRAYAARTIIASESNVELVFGVGVDASQIINTNIPKMNLPASYVIRIYDKNAVDAAADDMTVRLVYEERNA